MARRMPILRYGVYTYNPYSRLLVSRLARYMRKVQYRRNEEV